MTLVRRLVGKRKLESLDAFPKVPETYKESTAAGGTVSIVSYLLIGILIIFEISYYRSSKVSFYYDVDSDYESKLKINIDITVAMPCDTIGADIIDSTNQNNAYVYGKLNEEPTYYALTPVQKAQWDSIRHVNNYLRQEHHSLRDFLWTKDISNNLMFGRALPPREIPLSTDPDACRLYGTLIVNKVAGNFHVTVGKHIPLPIGHAHVSLLGGRTTYNFSHRIERFSFGEHIPSILNPLDGEEKVATAANHLFQYYIKVISTDVKTSYIKVKTYQYSTTEKDRVIDHNKNSHGMPGIYFKYDIDAIGVSVVEENVPFWKFLIRLCGIIGGIYATSGLISTIVTGVVDVITCKYLFKLQGEKTKREEATSSPPAYLLLPPAESASMPFSLGNPNNAQL